MANDPLVAFVVGIIRKIIFFLGAIGAIMAKKQVFDKRESKTLELKSTLPKFETLIKTCIAFANGIGGSIVIGVELVDLKHLGDGTTFLRNPNIARLARKQGLVEKMGTGIRLIFDSCRKAELAPPEFHEEGDFVKVVFFFKPLKKAEITDEESILELAKLRTELTIPEVMNYLNVSRNTATRKLNHLIQQKKLIRKGKGPSTKYVLT